MIFSFVEKSLISLSPTEMELWQLLEASLFPSKIRSDHRLKDGSDLLAHHLGQDS